MQLLPVPFFKALSDPTRLKLVLLLRQHETLCVCDLTEILDQPQPTVSRHLNHLKRVGILSSERKGTWIWYRLDSAMPTWCQNVITSIETDDSLSLPNDSLSSSLEQPCC
jgi:ArsR family transcriptional regulator